MVSKNGQGGITTMARIVIDPGHSGSPDPGAIGPTGLKEADVVMSIANSLANLLTADRHNVLLTRDGDDPDSDNLEVRTDMANDFGANLFVSIHANAFSDPNANGVETYYYTDGSANSAHLAELVQNEMLSATGLFNRGVKTANYWVLRYTNMPAVLVEAAFISNPVEEALLGESAFCFKCSVAIYKAIHQYLNQ